MMKKKLILILGDQLSLGLSSLAAVNPDNAVILMAEVRAEATYVRHHKKKIAFLFSAMRHFAEELSQAGWTADYVQYDASGNSGSLFGEVRRALSRHDIDEVILTEPGEWRLRDEMAEWELRLDVPVRILPDDRFLCSHEEFAGWAEGRKALRMEYFYRDMRRKSGLLMDGDNPAGGKWNYDAENRKAADRDLMMPQPLRFEPDDVTQQVIALVSAEFADHFGDLSPFWFGTSRDQAEAAFDHFLKTGLARFGDYQDAMLRDEKFLYHAVVSLYLNCGLLCPLDICRRVEAEYRAGRVPLNAAEGFIRQVIGWREYVRGIYWLKMPGYAQVNALEAKRPLPEFYWTADTDMACVRACVQQTKEEAYAHHIQRLMVTGTFALLAGVDPGELHQWYLAVYADAYEWVELPNTIGMSQFADGGLLASKPYAASGAYIDRMSDYCSGCHYKVKEKNGEKACPFNYLYWDFIARHKARLANNPRMGQMVRSYERFDDAKKQAIADDAKRFLGSLD
ncbi:cryptochrome/photolyase family protein [Sphingorhabdus arenilitoris]|uniref:Cryptochrome/photolyase family protein n=1 Tax=Sphingorhabdus arenilitoris TaxID=1490041 RepID=A0ABV8RIG4_9SPHN